MKRKYLVALCGITLGISLALSGCQGSGKKNDLASLPSASSVASQSSTSSSENSSDESSSGESSSGDTSTQESEKSSGELAAEENEKKISGYVDEAIELVNAGNKADAYALLDKAELECGKHTMINLARIKVEKIALFQELMPAVENQDYAKAMELANACSKELKKDDEVAEKIKLIEQHFVSEALSKAEALLHEKGIDEAVDALSGAIELMPTSKELTAKREEYENLRPVPFDFESFIDSSHLASGEKGDDGADPVYPFQYGTARDIYAYDVENSTWITWYGDNSGTDLCMLAYKLNGEYDVFSGSIFVPFSKRKTDSYGEKKIKLEVWGDGNKIGEVYAKNTESLVDFSFNIEGVNLLELKFYSQLYFYEGSYLFGSGYNYVTLSNVYLKKNY